MTDDREAEVVETKEDSNEGVQSETISELDRADAIAERQARENDRREKLLQREEALEARRRIGGVTEAGQEPIKKEQTPKEYADEVMSGKIPEK